MGNFLIRKQVRQFLKEFFQNQVVYANDPTQFPYLDGTDETNPSDLDCEFDAEFGEPSDDLEESAKEIDLDSRYIKVPTFDGIKKEFEPYKITNKH